MQHESALPQQIFNGGALGAQQSFHFRNSRSRLVATWVARTQLRVVWPSWWMTTGVACVGISNRSLESQQSPHLHRSRAKSDVVSAGLAKAVARTARHAAEQ
jgi:hypothetical protein